MFAFILKILLGAGCFLATRTVLKDGEGNTRFGPFRPISRKITYGLGVLFIGWAVIGTSVVWVSMGNIGTLKRVYFGSSLQPGRIVALEGELGPQARILTAGFHFEPFISLMYDIDEVEVFTVPNGNCALVSAKDGRAANSGSAFAEPWKEDERLGMINNATFFMTDGSGQRGPQTSCLMPGSYTINPFLWEEPRLIDAVRVEQGTVAVVKSSVRANVDFGAFKREVPADNVPRVLTAEKLPKGAAQTSLVPVGAIGVWEEALPNGLYYINTDAYRVTMVPTVAQVYEYKGGYKKRPVEVTINDKGQIVDRIGEVEDVPSVESAADVAISTKPEGWDVAQELRVLAQVRPDMAPFVVASLGLTQANAAQVIEDRVVTPIIRSVVRDVLGGAQIPFRFQEAVRDGDGKTILDESGEPRTRTASEFRAVRVLDLLDRRNSIEEAVETQAKPEALKEGVTINEVRLAESSIPAELLIARKREQLAQQLKKAWEQEQIAQGQRQLTENARAQADQQAELVTAQIYAEAMKKRAEGRATEGTGEQQYLTSIAEGQKLQAEALGKDATLRLQMFQQIIRLVTDIAERKPEILTAALENPQKFVPQIVVNGDSGGSLEGASAIFGSLMTGSGATSQTTK